MPVGAVTTAALDNRTGQRQPVPVAKKKRSSTEKDLKASVKELRLRAEKAEASVDRWKARAGRYE